MGHSRMITGKTSAGEVKGSMVSTLGLNDAHHVLLKGIINNPERKSAVVRMGRMTVSLQMLRTKEQIHRKKW